jgi:hypothetical protein
MPEFSSFALTRTRQHARRSRFVSRLAKKYRWGSVGSGDLASCWDTGVRQDGIRNGPLSAPSLAYAAPATIYQDPVEGWAVRLHGRPAESVPQPLR